MDKASGFHPAARLAIEQSDQRGSDQAANFVHRTGASPDSASAASRIWFPTGTMSISTEKRVLRAITVSAFLHGAPEFSCSLRHERGRNGIESSSGGSACNGLNSIGQRIKDKKYISFDRLRRVCSRERAKAPPRCSNKTNRCREPRCERNPDHRIGYRPQRRKVGRKGKAQTSQGIHAEREYQTPKHGGVCQPHPAHTVLPNSKE